MKCISWNVNGIRAALKKGFMDFFNEADADIFCLQETKCQEGQVELNPEGYYSYFHSAVKKGYSGTALFTKVKPLNVYYDFNEDIHNDEGRVIIAEYEKFYFVCAYVPNSKEGLARLDYRMEWEDWMRNHLIELNKTKPVIYTGDLNVAHNEIDLKNPATNHKNAGFSNEERNKMTELLNAGFVDTYRYLYPTKVEYSWWSYRFNARKNNAGWRIDYFIVSDNLKDKIEDAKILHMIEGSDHCPVELDINL